LGGEFQEEVLTALADRSGGRAVFLHRYEDIPRAIAAELAAARAVAARAIDLRIAPASGVRLRRVTRIRPALTTLHEEPMQGDASVGADGRPGAGLARPWLDLHLGDLEAGAPVLLLSEFLAPPRPAGQTSLGRIALIADGATASEAELPVAYRASAPPAEPEVLDAAARANAARLQRRALEALTGGAIPEAVRLLRAAAARFDDLGERALAVAARGQAELLERTGRTASLESKALTYATRRLGET